MKQLSREVLVAREIRICYKRALVNDLFFIDCSEKAVEAINYLLEDDQLDYKECFWVLSMTRSGRLVGISMISQGTQFSTLVSIKEILQIALLTHASRLIVVHNHPSGDLSISKSDKRLTRAIIKCFKYLDLTLQDHIVITSESHFSMAEEGLL